MASRIGTGEVGQQVQVRYLRRAIVEVWIAPVIATSRA
jgi:hypothetical protein